MEETWTYWGESSSWTWRWLWVEMSLVWVEVERARILHPGEGSGVCVRKSYQFVWAQIEIQEISFKRNYFTDHSVKHWDGEILDCNLGDSPSLTGCGPEQSALIHPAVSKGSCYEISRGPFQCWLFCDSFCWIFYDEILYLFTVKCYKFPLVWARVGGGENNSHGKFVTLELSLINYKFCKPCPLTAFFLVPVLLFILS